MTGNTSRCQAEGKNFNGKMTHPARQASGVMMPYGQECELKPSEVSEKLPCEKATSLRTGIGRRLLCAVAGVMLLWQAVMA